MGREINGRKKPFRAPDAQHEHGAEVRSLDAFGTGRKWRRTELGRAGGIYTGTGRTGPFECDRMRQRESARETRARAAAARYRSSIEKGPAPAAAIAPPG
jgi:hypothetical protein